MESKEINKVSYKLIILLRRVLTTLFGLIIFRGIAALSIEIPYCLGWIKEMPIQITEDDVIISILYLLAGLIGMIISRKVLKAMILKNDNHKTNLSEEGDKK